MGLFDKNYEIKNSNYYDEIKQNLKAKDGNIHIILIQTYMNNGNRVEIEYTTKVNYIIDCMKRDGYEIVNLELEILGNWRYSKRTCF